MKEVKRTIFSVPYSQAALIQEQSKKALKYLIQNEKLITLDENDISSIKDAKSFATTPMFDLYSRILLETDFKKFTMLNFAEFKDSVPEIFLLDDIVIDGKYLDSAVPKQFQNAWVNLTPILGKRIPTNNSLPVTDIPKLHGVVVRAYLTMSYHDSKAWLNPKLCSFIIESYSIIIARLLQRSYNLNIDEYLFIQTLFAAYYAQLLSPDNIDNGEIKFPALLNRCAFLGSINDIIGRLSQVYSHMPNDRLMTTTDVVKMINVAGPSRMNKLEAKHLYRLFSSGTTESQSMLLALDYPPYWTYQILKVVSGVKNPMINTIFKTVNLKKKIDEFISDLSKSPTLEIDR